MMFVFAARPAAIEAGSNPNTGLGLFPPSHVSVWPPAFKEQANFAGRGTRPILVFDIEGLYSAVNDPQNAGAQIQIAPGFYPLSVSGPVGTPRPNGGRLELQENMSLTGVYDDRDAVVIDGSGLTTASCTTTVSVGLPPNTTGAIRMGRGSNAVEWLTIRNAPRCSAGIETDLLWPGTAFIRIAHVVSHGNVRGIDVRNFGPSAAGAVIDAEIIDNDLFGNVTGLGEGMRFVNIQGANGGVITARLTENRSYGNLAGLLIENNRANFSSVSVVSTGDQLYENGLGALVGGGLSSNSIVANGNVTSFIAYGTRFENNRGPIFIDGGGLVVIAGENTSIPNGTSNNTVNVELRGCYIANNQIVDLGAFGARSNPLSAGLPGTNNRVTISGFSGGRGSVVASADSIPAFPGGLNSVVLFP